MVSFVYERIILNKFISDSDGFVRPWTNHFGYIYLMEQPKLEKQQQSDVQLSEGLALVGVMGGPIQDPSQTPRTITALSYCGV